MADVEDQYVTSSVESAVVAKSEITWNQPHGVPRWCLRSEIDSQRGPEDHCFNLSGEVDLKRKPSPSPHDGDDESESGLELSLGLSIGGSVCKLKVRNGMKDVGGGSDQWVNEKTMDDGSPTSTNLKEKKKLVMGIGDGGFSRTRAFWQEFGASKDNQQDDKGSLMSAESHVRERHSQLQSSHSSITSLTSLPSGAQGRSPLNAILPDSWRCAENHPLEEQKPASSHQIWQALQQERASKQEQLQNPKEESPLFKDLSGISTQQAAAAAAWVRYAQNGVAMPLLEGFNDKNVENAARGLGLPLNGLNSLVHQASGNTNSMQSGSNPTSTQGKGSFVGGTQHPGDVQPQITKRELSPQDEIAKAANEQQRHVQDAIEQQRKRVMYTQQRQAARNKRKRLIEEQKQQKKAKKEEERAGTSAKHHSSRPGTPPTGTKVSASTVGRDVSVSREVSSPPDSQEGGSIGIGFLRRTGSGMGSGMWGRAGPWDGQVPAPSPPENSERVSSSLDPNEEGKQLLEIRRALQREKDRAAKEKDSEMRVVDNDRRGVIADGSKACSVGSQTKPEPSSAGSTSGVVGSEFTKGAPPTDSAWVQKMLEMQMNSHTAYQMAASLMEIKDSSQKGIPDLNGLQRRVPDSVPLAEMAQPASQNIDCSEVSRANEDRNRSELRETDGHPSRPRPDASVYRSNSLPSGPVHGAGSMMALGTYTHSSAFPVMHVPYPFPIPVGSTAGLPFPVPYPFPYLMQFAPSADSSSGQDKSATPSIPFHVPTNYHQFQVPVPADVASNWTQVLRPQPTPPHSPPRSLTRSNSGMTEDDSRCSEGVKGTENLTHRNVSPARDISPNNAGTPLLRASSLGSIHGGQTGAFARLRPSANLPPTHQFAAVRNRGDISEQFLFREGSVNSNSAFASLVAAVEASQGLSAAVASVTNAPAKGSTLQRAGSGVKLERSTSRISPEAQEDTDGASTNNKPGYRSSESYQGDSGSRPKDCTKQPNGSHFGSTQHMPSVTETLVGQEASSLKPGIAAGQMFGGSGSSPDLPWVTCTGAGPNGKTICGVLYRYNKCQVRIVCACHGEHMTPSEFVQHAGSVDLSNPEKNIVVNPFPLGSQAASAQG